MDLIIRQVTWLTLLSWLMILTALLLSVCLSDTWDATMVLLWVTSIFCGTLLIVLNVALRRQSRELAENDVCLQRLMDVIFDAMVITDHQASSWMAMPP